MREFGVKLIQFTNMNPIFKGTSVAIVGILALLFAMWMQKRWKEPIKGGFLIFIGLSIFIVLYGLFILVFQPRWWDLPY
jgi:cadmium resistance protein CadD (predicted permease)